MPKLKKLLFIPCFAFIASGLLAQDNAVADSVSAVKETHKKTYSRPRRASLMSTFLPGLGQAYNKKYWKIPLIYGAFGGFGYMFVSNNEQFAYFRKNLRAEYDEDPETINSSGYSGDNLLDLKTKYKKNRDLAGIAIGLIYILNIIDANVDAHLKTFDVSDDLSLRIEPWHTIYRNPAGYATATGLTFKLNFK